MISYPQSFTGSCLAESGINNSWETSSSNMTSSCSVPPEFEGPGGAFSPEDYFLMAIQNCFVATFKVFAQYSKLDFSSLKVATSLKVDKNEFGQPVMKELELKINLNGVQDSKKAQILVKKALDNGFILKSVKTTIIPEVHINDERVI